MLTRETYHQYSRHFLLDNYDEVSHQRLQNAHVLIVGMGGLGCQCAQSLVTAGIGNLTLCDDDTIDVSNLPRQWLYRHKNCGVQKVVVAKNVLSGLTSDTRIFTRQHRLNRDSNLTPYSLILDCSDNLPTRLLVNSLAYQYRIRLISAAASGVTGQIFAINPASRAGCYQCLHSEGSPQTCLDQGILNSVVAMVGQFQALQAIYALTGLYSPSWGILHRFNGSELKWQQYEVPSCPRCDVCGGQHAYSA